MEAFWTSLFFCVDAAASCASDERLGAVATNALTAEKPNMKKQRNFMPVEGVDLTPCGGGEGLCLQAKAKGEHAMNGRCVVQSRGEDLCASQAHK